MSKQITSSPKIHLLTGSTGFVGRYLVEKLLRHNQNVWLIIRPLNGLSAKTRGEKIFNHLPSKYQKNLHIIQGDITLSNCGINTKNLTRLQKHNIVFWHLAANLSFKNADKENIEKTNILGIQNITKLANKIANKIVYTSTAYVCGNASSFQENELNKNQEFRNMYERTKFIAEKYFQQHCRIPYVIFRPSIIIGDAYQGKVEGCTFGYYRYAFIIYFLKQQIIKKLKQKNTLSFFLKIFRTKYNKETDTLSIPFLFIPYPIGGQVDLISIDYVIDAMFDLHNKFKHSRVIHLTNPNPPKYLSLFRAALEDIGLKKVKTIPLPPVLFKALVKFIYFIFPSIRKYSKSVMWYIPYISKKCLFDQSTIKKYYRPPSKITRQTMHKINTHAKENILKNIDIS